MAKLKLSQKELLSGAVAGAASGVASRSLGNLGTPVASIAVGAFMNNPALQTLGGYQLGASLMGGGGSSSNGVAVI